ncbi:MAG: PAS domain-containing protein [Polyangiaceae bacterium]|nr:PAS domain-containing protein [Polyangiaceae bacterium]
MRLPPASNDGTQLAAAEAQLRLASEKLRLATSAAKIGVWEWELTTNKLTWDARMCALHGLPEGAAPTLELWKQLIADGDRAHFEHSTEQALNGTQVFDIEFRVTNATTEEPVYIRAAASILRDSAGRAGSMVGVSWDVTRERSAEAQLKKRTRELERSNKDLEQFAYSASHDLQEPLRAVAGCAQLLKARYGKQLDSGGHELVEHMADAARRMQSLITGLLAYSRVSSKGAPFERVSLNAVVEVALKNLSSAIQDCDAMVEVDPLPTLSGDRAQLVSLFQNVIGNALKYRGSKPPHIKIHTEIVKGRNVFHVTDNGIGVELEYADRIFELFQRLHSREEYSGAGLGLALCKKIAERHGGRMWVSSTLNEGSTFHFILTALGERLVPERSR